MRVRFPGRRARAYVTVAGPLCRVVLGLNGLRMSTVGLRAMLVPLPWMVSWDMGPASLLGARRQFLDFSVSRAEQGALVGCSEVTHLPAPGLSTRGLLCSWKSFCRVDHREGGNLTALPTAVQKGWGGELRTHLASSTATVELAEGAPSSQAGQHHTRSPTVAPSVE